MALPHKISTLLYVFDAEDRVLLLQRLKEPNRGLWSPPGGKLDTALGESPYACARREAGEELGLEVPLSALHLTGLVSESGYQGTAHWLMFLFEIRLRLSRTPPDIDEGRFMFFARSDLESLAIPVTDRERLWPWFWEHRGGFFSAHCACTGPSTMDWTLEESLPCRHAHG